MSFGLWDDQTAFDPRWLGLSNDATAIAFRAGTWSRGPWAERPGYATLRQLRGLSGGISAADFREAVTDLLDVGLLEQVDGAYRVHGPRNAPSLAKPPAEPVAAGPVKLSRSEAGKLGGAKSAETRRNAFGSAQPVPKQTPKHTEAPAQSTAEAKLEAPAEAPRSKPETTDQVASKHPIPIPKQAAAASPKLVGSAPEASASKQEAAAASFASEVRELAEAVQQDPELARSARPHTWPELVNVARNWNMLAGRSTPRLGEYSTDPDVRALVGLLAAGWPPAELVELGGAVGTWLAAETPDGRPRTLAMVTPAVLRIAQQQLEREAAVESEARALVTATADNHLALAAGDS